MTTTVLTLKHVARTCALLAGALLILAFIALAVGAASLPLSAWGSALWEALTGSPSALSPEHRTILLFVRLPRILLAMIVGAALGVAGAGYQALLRNPLADPYVLGVTLTIAGVYFLGQRDAELSPYTLLLAGVITASFLSALITFLLNFLSGRDLRGMAFWLMGDLSSPAPMALGWLALGVLAAVAAIYAVAGPLNLLLGGEAEAEALGVNVRQTKFIVYLAASLATGLAVSVSGAIGYVGLLVPHLVRLLFGSDYRLLIPATALSGAVVLLAADTLARPVVAPTELPVGAVTAVVGAPVFIYLLRSRLPGRPSGPGSGGGA